MNNSQFNLLWIFHFEINVLIEEIYDGQSSTASTMIRSDSPQKRPYVSKFLVTITCRFDQIIHLKRESFWEILLCITKRIYKSESKLIDLFINGTFFKEKELIKASRNLSLSFNLNIHSIVNDYFHKYSRYTALDTNEKIFGKQKQKIFLKTVNIFLFMK